MPHVRASPPDDLAQVGKSVVATGYGIDDLFPELRALAWKRGAHVLPDGVHVHAPTTLFAAIAARDERDRDELMYAADALAMEAFVHGRTVFVVPYAPNEEDRLLTEKTKALLALAGGRPVAAELLCVEWSDADVVAALQRLGHQRPERARLWIRFSSVDDGSAEARRFAATFEDQHPIIGSNWVLLDPVLGRKRVAVLAYRQQAEVFALDAEAVTVEGYFRRHYPRQRNGQLTEKGPRPTVQALQDALRRQGEHLRDVSSTRDGDDAVTVELVTAEPGRVLSAMEAVAAHLDLDLWPDLSDPEPVRAMLRRLVADLDRG